MRDIKTSKVFVSVSRSELSSEQNHRNHMQAYDTLRREGIRFHIVRGAYRGHVEESFMLYSTNAEEHAAHLAIGIDLARSFKQDSILEVCNDDTAMLHRLGTGYAVDKVGTFREVSKEQAIAKESYTCDPFSGRYFIVD